MIIHLECTSISHVSELFSDQPVASSSDGALTYSEMPSSAPMPWVWVVVASVGLVIIMALTGVTYVMCQTKPLITSGPNSIWSRQSLQRFGRNHFPATLRIPNVRPLGTSMNGSHNQQNTMYGNRTRRGRPNMAFYQPQNLGDNLFSPSHRTNRHPDNWVCIPIW